MKLATTARLHFSFRQLMHSAVVRSPLRIYLSKVRAVHSKRIENITLMNASHAPPDTAATDSPAAVNMMFWY